MYPTYLWAEEDLTLLEGSPVIAATESMRRKLEAEYATVESDLLNKFPEVRQPRPPGISRIHLRRNVWSGGKSASGLCELVHITLATINNGEASHPLRALHLFGRKKGSTRRRSLPFYVPTRPRYVGWPQILPKEVQTYSEFQWAFAMLFSR